MAFRKKKDEKPTPPWLTWGVLAFIGVAVLLNVMGVRPGNTVPPVVPAPIITPGKDAAVNWNIFNIDAYKGRLIPGYGHIQITDTRPGTGAEAVCGQDAAIRYAELPLGEGAPPGGVAVTDADLTAAEMRLGADAQAPEALQASVIGMRAGGRRTVVVPAERTREKKFPTRYVIELVRLSPEAPTAPEGGMPLKMFDTRPGSALDVQCGAALKLHFTVWDLAGNRLLSTRAEGGKPFALTLGASQVMLGMEQGILGMQGDAARTLIIPPYLQQPLRTAEVAAPPEEAEDSPVQPPDFLHKLVLPAHQSLLVDVELVP